MPTNSILQGSSLDQVLTDAVKNQRYVAITHHHSDGWRTYKSQFLSSSAVDQLLWIKPPIFKKGTQRCIPNCNESLGVTFRVGHKKCIFGTRLGVAVGDNPAGQWALRWPEQIQQYQRRVFERAQPPRGQVISVRFWRADHDQQDSADARTVRHGQLENLSAGGMLVQASSSPEMEAGATYRCAFTPRAGKPILVVDALVRHQDEAESIGGSIGFQFIGLEATSEGRCVLDRLARAVTHFQRARSRRHRSLRSDAYNTKTSTTESAQSTLG